MQSLRNNLMIILSMVFSLLSLLLLSIGLMEFQKSGDLNLCSIDYFASGLVCLVLSFFFSYRRRQTLKLHFIKKSLTSTLIKCNNENCNFKEEREFKAGDYIFKSLGKCPKCDGNLYIAAIYNRQLKK